MQDCATQHTGTRIVPHRSRSQLASKKHIASPSRRSLHNDLLSWPWKMGSLNFICQGSNMLNGRGHDISVEQQMPLETEISFVSPLLANTRWRAHCNDCALFNSCALRHECDALRNAENHTSRVVGLNFLAVEMHGDVEAFCITGRQSIGAHQD